MSLYLKIQDTVNGKCGSVYFTIDGRRFEVPGIQKIEAHESIKERTMTTVGTVKTQSALSGVEGSGSMTINYWAVSIFGKMIDKYRKTGVYDTFDILVINEDPANSIGRRSVSFSGCVLSGDIPLAVLDATSDDSLTVDISFKYDDYAAIDDFSEPVNVGREGE
jgi:hypothetical protein